MRYFFFSPEKKVLWSNTFGKCYLHSSSLENHNVVSIVKALRNPAIKKLLDFNPVSHCFSILNTHASVYMNTQKYSIEGMFYAAYFGKLLASQKWFEGNVVNVPPKKLGSTPSSVTPPGFRLVREFALL